MKELLVLAKQQASKAKGLNFYVTKGGIKQDFNLFGADYEYKVYFKKSIVVEDSGGKRIKPTKPEVAVSPKSRNSTNEKIGEDAKQ